MSQQDRLLRLSPCTAVRHHPILERENQRQQRSRLLENGISVRAKKSRVGRQIRVRPQDVSFWVHGKGQGFGVEQRK